MATACDLAWGHLDINVEIPQLTVDADASAWKPALEIRRKLVALLLSHPPFLHFEGDHAAQEHVDGLARKVLAQGADQLKKKFTIAGEPNSHETKRNVLGSLLGSQHPGRTFGTVS